MRLTNPTRHSAHPTTTSSVDHVLNSARHESAINHLQTDFSRVELEHHRTGLMPGLVEMVRKYYELVSVIEDASTDGPRSRRSAIQHYGAELSSQTMQFVCLGKHHLYRRLTYFWPELVARPFADNGQRQPAGDSLLTSEAGSFCVEFEIPAISISDIVFWQLRQMVSGRTDPSFNGTAFAEGKSHCALDHRQDYFVSFLSGEAILKAKVPRSSLKLDTSDRDVTTDDLQHFAAILVAEVERRESTASFHHFDPTSASQRGLRHWRRISAVTAPERAEVSDLRINIHRKHVPLSIVQFDQRSLTANGTPVVFNIGPVSPDQTLRIVGKYHHTYADGAVVVAEARKLGNHPQSRVSPGNSDPLTELLSAHEARIRPIITPTTSSRGVVAIGLLHRNHYQDRLNNLFLRVEKHYGHSQATEGEQHDGKQIAGHQAEFQVTIHLVLAMAILLLTGRKSLHFLESVKGNHSVAPSLLKIPGSVLKAIRMGQEPTPELRKRLITALRLWQIDRRETQHGRGIVPIMAIAAGRLRAPLQLAGRLTDPVTIADLTETLLLSTLVNGKRQAHPGSTKIYGFTTAESTVYPHGACGAIDTDDGSLMVSMRTIPSLAGYGLSDERLTIAFEQVLAFMEEIFPSQRQQAQGEATILVTA